MTINWHGQSFFEISAKGLEETAVKIVIDPFSEELGLKLPRVEADVLLVSHSRSDHSNKALIKGEPFIIDSPGEYEVKGIFVKGIPAFHDNQQGQERGAVTIYKVEAEQLKICHLSDLGQKELTEEQLEALGQVDVLMIPVGSKHSLDAKGAAEVISQIEPRIVIPMHYKIPGLKVDLEGVDKFLKQMGAEDVQKESKLKNRSRDLPQEETKIILLEP